MAWLQSIKVCEVYDFSVLLGAAGFTGSFFSAFGKSKGFRILSLKENYTCLKQVVHHNPLVT